MIDRLGHHRPDDADLIGHRGQAREDRADLKAALAASLEWMLRRETNELMPLKLRDRHAARD